MRNTKHEWFQKKYIISEFEDIPEIQVWLVLWTSKYTSDGRRNLFYHYRIQATKDLYESGKILYIIVSWDNGRVEHNEPDTMKQDLIALGIPEEKIYADYAGFRTLDSVLRAREIFWQETYILISQKFHLERAIYLAHKHGIEAYWYPAQDVPIGLAHRVWIRERLARVKMMYDVMVWVEPKFGGGIEIWKL